jgi:D-psicose/D-tagatose/L-ribulose 3-epimerase
MRFSICSWTFGNTPLEQVFAFVSSAGYSCIDLTATVDDFDCDRVSRLAREFSLEISGLTCDSGWPAEEHDLANKNLLNRQKAVAYFKRQIQAVRTVGGDYLIVVPSAVGKSSPMGRDTVEDWKWGVESVCNLTETAEENGVTLVIEPLNRYESCIVNTAEDALRFVKEVNHRRVKALLDTYHMNIEESDMHRAFLTLYDWVELVHFALEKAQTLAKEVGPSSEGFRFLRGITRARSRRGLRHHPEYVTCRARANMLRKRFTRI